MRIMTEIPLILKNNNSLRILGKYTSAQQTTLNYLPSVLGFFFFFFFRYHFHIFFTVDVSADLNLLLEEKVSHFLSNR